MAVPLLAPKPSALELQRWMRWVITDPRGVAPALEDGAPSAVRDCLTSIAETGELARVARLDVYAEAYYARLLDSLGQDFSALQRLLGEGSFQKLVAAFLKRFPSRTTNIGEVGMRLPQFLSSHYLGDEYPAAQDLADLERRVIEAFYAVDTPAMSAEEWGRIAEDAWGTARLGLDASVRLMESTWSLETAWESRDEPEFRSPVSVEGSKGLLIFRLPDGWVKVQRLAPLPFQILLGAERGLELNQIFEGIGEEAEGAPFSEWFAEWVQSGVIRAVTVRGEAL